MEAANQGREVPAYIEAPPAAKVATQNAQPDTIRLGAIEVGLPPDPNSPVSVSHYINRNRSPIMAVAREYFVGGLVPKAILQMDNAQEAVAAIFTILTTGIELGIGYATALRAIYIVDGRACLSADLMRGLAVQAGCHFEYLQNDEKACSIRVLRNGALVGQADFSMEDAKRANLTHKNNWKTYPREMLAARAGAKAARMGAPDRLAGLYDPDELEVAPPAPPKMEPPRATKKKEEHVAAPAEPPVVAGPAPTRMLAQPPSTAVPLMTDDQRRKLFSLATALGLKGSREFPCGSGTELRSVIKADDEITKALGLPSGEDVIVKGMNVNQAQALIRLLEKRDAAAALGEQQ